MKKTLTALAVMAIAASAYADMVGTWASWGSGGTASGTQKGDYTYLDDNVYVGVGNLSVFGGATTTSTTTDSYTIRNLNNGGGLRFAYSILDGYELAGATIEGTSRVSNAGPAQMDWFLGNADGATGDALNSIKHNNSTATSIGDDGDLKVNLSGDGYIYLLANTQAGRASGTNPAIDAGGTFGFRPADGAVTLSGTVRETSAVPEPATMSLLGLGALAMALRRKLRK